MYRYFKIMASLAFWAPDVSGATMVLFHNKNVFPAYAGIQKHLTKRSVNVATKPKVFFEYIDTFKLSHRKLLGPGCLRGDDGFIS
jgi:hypothetical protein